MLYKFDHQFPQTQSTVSKVEPSIFIIMTVSFYQSIRYFYQHFVTGMFLLLDNLVHCKVYFKVKCIFGL